MGFGSLSPYKERPAYSPTVEDSVYVHRDRRGAGVGRVAARRAGPARPDLRLPLGRRPDRRRPRRVDQPARGARLRAGRRGARGRPQARPLARRRRHAADALSRRVGSSRPGPGRAHWVWWAREDSNLRSLRNRFTACPLWPLGYGPGRTLAAVLLAGIGGPTPPCPASMSSQKWTSKRSATRSTRPHREVVHAVRLQGHRQHDRAQREDDRARRPRATSGSRR